MNEETLEVEKEKILNFIENKKFNDLRKYLENVNSADFPSMFEELEAEEQVLLIYRLLSKEQAAEVFAELDSDVQENLINCITLIHQSEQGIVERTGLHEREFLDTYRISTSTELPIHRNGSVHMLNLVEGELATLISEDGRFAPMELHYAETCIVPEAAGTYLIHSIDGTCVRIVIACVRS